LNYLSPIYPYNQTGVLDLDLDLELDGFLGLLYFIQIFNFLYMLGKNGIIVLKLSNGIRR